MVDPAVAPTDGKAIEIASDSVDNPAGNVGADSPRRRTARRVSKTVVLLGLVSMCTDISTESVNAVLPLYLVVTLGLSPQAFGFLNGLYNGVSAAIRLLGGWLSDRTDRPKWVAALGYVASLLSRVGLLFASGLTALSLVISGDRLGKGLRTAPRDALIAAASPPQALSRAFGVHRSLDSLGAAIGPLLAFALLTVVADDFRTVFVVSLGFAIIGVAILLLLVPDSRPRRAELVSSTRTRPRSAHATPDGNAAAALPRIRLRHLANPRLARLVAAAVLLGALTVGDSFLYLALQLRDDYASNYYALLMVGMNVAYLSLAVPIGQIADRIGRVKVFVAGQVALVVCYLCAAGPYGGVAMTIGCLAALGGYYAATDGILAALASRAVPAGVRASSIALAQTCQALAAFGSSLVVGVLWATLGLSDAILCFVPMLVLAIPVVILLLRGIDTGTDAVGDHAPAAAVT